LSLNNTTIQKIGERGVGNGEGERALANRKECHEDTKAQKTMITICDDENTLHFSDFRWNIIVPRA
jgi:hypothetical protein